MLAMIFVGVSGGIIYYVINPTGEALDIIPSALFGVLLLAFIGIGIYSLLVSLCMLFGPNRHLGWEGLPPWILRLGIASIGTYLLFFLIGMIIAITAGSNG
jgi:hypothetical protein